MRDRKGHAILCIALNPQSGDFSGAILGVRSVALLHLIKVLFYVWEFLGSCLVLISPFGSNDFSFLGSSLVFDKEEIGKVQRNGILILGINYE